MAKIPLRHRMISCKILEKVEAELKLHHGQLHGNRRPVEGVSGMIRVENAYVEYKPDEASRWVLLDIVNRAGFSDEPLGGSSSSLTHHG